MRIILTIILIMLAVPSLAEVRVQSQIPVNRNGSELVQARSYTTIPLGSINQGDEIDVSVTVTNAVYKDLSAYVIDKTNLNLMNQGLEYKSAGVQKQISPIQFKTKSWSYGEYYLVLDNRFANFLGKKIDYNIKTVKTLPEADRMKLAESYDAIYDSLKSTFIFPDFNINIVMCGMENAFSNPDITLCSELVQKLIQDGQPRAIVPIFMHELGHTLLNLWGLPGFDNEDVVDEFATIMLVRMGEDGKRSINEAMEWFSGHDVQAEVLNMLKKGDRHSLSIQRIRNMERLMASPENYARRWNRLLYPHMTDKALNGIINSTGKFDEPALAKNELEKRRK
ncbi:DUF4344 domain-containing metallopeptidase [Geobacter argillaceus]|uniref:Putative metallopeptidase DUF4344 n=1 Tax=Geobacter argillaceus TaxID=345631 RepID=A0A562VLA6_9BACT|nr:DUF4344 domain-containing metallopeptidase [Geobacter argillaceus]TWJ18709.1 putative metallopeptidase DUF4344 [Geobacter argillaceus]